jgi:hypothetical protein
LRVERTSGSYVMTATAQGLPEGTRWRLSFEESSSSDPDAIRGADAHAVVRSGGWAVSRTVPAVQAPYFDVVAFGPGRIDLHGRFCTVLAQPALPFAGVTFCHHSLELAMTATHRGDVETVVRWVMIGARPGTQWTVTLVATKGGTHTGVSSRPTATHRDLLGGKVTFTGPVNPRLQLQVSADGGQRCTLGMHRVLARPAQAATTPLKAREAPLTRTSEPPALRALLSGLLMPGMR